MSLSPRALGARRDKMHLYPALASRPTPSDALAATPALRLPYIYYYSSSLPLPLPLIASLFAATSPHTHTATSGTTIPHASRHHLPVSVCAWFKQPNHPAEISPPALNPHSNGATRLAPQSGLLPPLPSPSFFLPFSRIPIPIPFRFLNPSPSSSKTTPDPTNPFTPHKAASANNNTRGQCGAKQARS
ncbi:hypothetical protein DFH09DRAFT_1358536 [Mycena vulgaris]|nr:hypothetical protein DFH09DRAFT_1358536 [Mycena vulgaris]